MIGGANLNNFAVDENGRITLAGASSGIDFKAAVDSIITARRIPIDRIEADIAVNDSRVTAFNDLRSLLNVMRGQIDTLRGKVTVGNVGDIFEAKQAFASTSRTDNVVPTAAGSLLGVSVTNAADLGSRTIEILQIAQAQKISSGAASGTTANLGTAYGGAANSISGSFEINGQRIDVQAGDTLIGLADRINNANTGSNASKVTASIVSTGTFQNFLILTADETGKPIDIRVSQRLGSDNATSTTADLQTALGLGSPVEGNFEINGKLVTVATTDTMASLITKINAAGAGVTASTETIGANSRLILTADDASKTISLTNATHQSKVMTDAVTALTTLDPTITGGAQSFVIRKADGSAYGTVNYNADTDTLTTLQTSISAIAGVTASIVPSGTSSILQVAADDGTSMTIDTDTGNLVSKIALNKDVMSQLGLSTNRGDTFKNELSVTNNVLEKLSIGDSAAFRNGLTASKVALNDGFDKIVFDGTQSAAAYEITFAQATQTMTVTLADGIGATSDTFVLTQPNGTAETARFTVGGVGITIDVGTAFDKTANITVAANTASVTGGTGTIDAATVEVAGSTGNITGFTSSALTLGSLSTPSSITITSGAFSGTFDGTAAGAKSVTLADGNGNSLKVNFTTLTVFDGAETAGSLTLSSLQNVVAAPKGIVLTNELTAAQKARVKADNLLDLAALAGNAENSATAALNVTGTLNIDRPVGADVSIAVAATDTLNVLRDRINANTDLQAAGISASVTTDSAGKFSLNIRRTDLTVGDKGSILTQKPTASNAALGIANSMVFSRDDGTAIDTIAVAGTDSLDSIAANINGSAALQNAGVSATVVASGSTFSLQINYNTNLTVTSPDGAVTALGLARPDLIVERDSNTVSDLFKGTTVTLFQAEVGTTVKLDIDRDLAGVKQAVTDFVTAYNDVKTFIGLQQLTDSATGEAAADSGPLFGNPTLGNIDSGISNILGQGAAGLTNSDLYQVLAQIGVTFVDNETVSDASLRDTLEIDETVLDAALLNNPDDVRRLFAFDFSASDPQVALIGFTGQTQAKTGGYKLNITHDGTKITAADIDGVAGSITINGNTLTMTDKTGAEGLKLIYNGSVSVSGVQLDISNGVGSQMFFELDRILEPQQGSVQTEIDTFTDQNNFSQTRIDEMLARLDRQRQTLLARFVRMEEALTTINNTLSAIQQQFAGLESSGQS